MNIFLKYSLLVILSAQLFSCTNGSDRNNGSESEAEVSQVAKSGAQLYFEAIFLTSDDHIFRDVDLDLSIAKVQEIETAGDLVLSANTDDYLQYEKDLNVDTVKGIDFVEVKYIFDDSDRLDIVTVNYYIQDSIMTIQLFDHLNSAFMDKYGDYYIDNDGYTVWESSYKRADSIDVTYDIGIRKYVKLNDPGITIELMRFGSL